MREGLGAVKLVVGISGNDVTVSNKGEATCSSSKQILKAFPLVIKFIKICHNTASEALDPVLNAPEKSVGQRAEHNEHKKSGWSSITSIIETTY